jgi:hypothetical protein
MADRRYTLKDALRSLREDAKTHEIGICAQAQRLEEHLRLAFEAREVKPSDVDTAEIVHVFELNANGGVPFGAHLQLMAYGAQIGQTLVAPAIKPGRYRAVLMLTKLEDPA